MSLDSVLDSEPRRSTRRSRPVESGSTDGPRIHGAENAAKELLHSLTYLGELHAAVKRQLAAEIEVTLPQFNILMVISQHPHADGISVGDVAGSLHVSGPFITMEATKLVAKRFVEKVPNPSDGRGTLLRLSAHMVDRIAAVSDKLRRYDARFLGLMEKDAISTLNSSIAKLILGGESALLELSVPRAIDFVGRRNSRK